MLKLYFDPKVYLEVEEVLLAGVETPDGQAPPPNDLEGYLKARLVRLIRQGEQAGMNIHQLLDDYMHQEPPSDQPEGIADWILAATPYPYLLSDLKDRLQNPGSPGSVTRTEVEETFDAMTFLDLLAMLP